MTDSVNSVSSNRRRMGETLNNVFCCSISVLLVTTIVLFPADPSEHPDGSDLRSSGGLGLVHGQDRQHSGDDYHTSSVVSQQRCGRQPPPRGLGDWECCQTEWQ